MLCPEKLRYMEKQSNQFPKYLHEDEEQVPEECRGLMSSLARDRGWVISNLYQYQGFWHSPRQLGGVLASQRLLKAQATDLFLVTTPKSGTTWLKAMAFAVVNRARYPDFSHHPLLTNNPHELVPFLELKVYVDGNLPDFSNMTSPRLFSTHMPFNSLPVSITEFNCKVVYLCRNPRDTFISLWHFANKLRPKSLGPISVEEAFNRFCRGLSLCGPFSDHVLGYWKESSKEPSIVLFLKYENIKEEPKASLRKLAQFLGYPFTLDEEREEVVDKILELCSFDKLSNLEVNKTGKMSSGEEYNAFFRRGEVGDWEKYLTPDMIEHCDRIIEKFNSYGLQF